MLKGVKLLREAGNEKPISLKELRKLKKEKEDVQKETEAGRAGQAAILEGSKRA